MKIIISPAKKMNIETDILECSGFPAFMEKTKALMEYMKSLDYEEAKKMWGCSDRLARENFQRLSHMNLYKTPTPALLSYEGIQYQYMAPGVFEDRQWKFVQEHLRILSGFYGVVKPLDGVVPYRLEMQAKINLPSCKDLYTYWGSDIYKEVSENSRWILNLASKEYSKSVEKFLKQGDRYITCTFGEWKNGKIIQKGTLAKRARGEMVRFLAGEEISEPEGVKEFRGLGFSYKKEFSTEENYVFLKEEEK